MRQRKEKKAESENELEGCGRRWLGQGVLGHAMGREAGQLMQRKSASIEFGRDSRGAALAACERNVGMILLWHSPGIEERDSL